MDFFKKKNKEIDKNSFFVINEFLVPKHNEKTFVDYYRTNIELLVSHKGNIDCRLFRSKEDADSITFISIMGWESEESFNDAKREIDSIARKTGLNVLDFKDKHDIEVVRRVCTEVPILF